MYDAFELNKSSVRLQYVSNELYAPPPPPPPPPVHGYELDLQQAIRSTGGTEELLQVGFVRVLDLYRMYTEMGQRLFERNIRSGLDPDGPVNKRIRTAFADIVSGKADPADFVFNHNGVTIAAEELNIEDGIARIVEPRILNGAQTITRQYGMTGSPS